MSKQQIIYTNTTQFIDAWEDADVCYNQVEDVFIVNEESFVVVVWQPRKEVELSCLVHGQLTKEAAHVIEELRLED